MQSWRCLDWVVFNTSAGHGISKAVSRCNRNIQVIPVDCHLSLIHQPHRPRPLLHCPEVLRCEDKEDVVHSQLFRQVFARCVRSSGAPTEALIASTDWLVRLDDCPGSPPHHTGLHAFKGHSESSINPFNFWCQWLRINHIWWYVFNWCVVKVFDPKTQKCVVTWFHRLRESKSMLHSEDLSPKAGYLV